MRFLIISIGDARRGMQFNNEFVGLFEAITRYNTNISIIIADVLCINIPVGMMHVHSDAYLILSHFVQKCHGKQRCFLFYLE